ncbi:phosphatase PAP2 family protein [Nocardioidaceae bacterium]|nr:phosphatase PAP2 family protein [Nocardioidaceae bacterium]
MTTVTSVALWTRGHRRAAWWTAAVMTATWISVSALKFAFARQRPEFPDPITVLESNAFPSGHATGTGAGAGVAIVLTMIFVRRRGLRRALTALWLGVAVVVGLDRLLLGVHVISDVVAGWALASAIVLAALLAYDPAPQATERQAPPSGPLQGRRLAVVLNPIKVESVSQFKREVIRAAAKGGWDEPRWYETTVEDPGASMAEQAALDGAELVIVCGGDGTVRAVCSELAGTGVPVGIVPAGTGNLLARNLDLPLFLPSAVDVALHGQDRAIDLVRIGGDGIEDGQHFLVMAGMGMDAQLMDGVNEKVKAKVGWVAYILSGLKSLMFPAVRLEITLDDGQPTVHRARTVVIGNVGYLQAGMPLLPDAAIDDGTIDVVLINPRRFLSWLRVVWRVLTRGKRTDDVVNRFTCRSVVVTASTETPRQLDGDSIGPGRELRADVEHGRLLVRSPR